MRWKRNLTIFKTSVVDLTLLLFQSITDHAYPVLPSSSKWLISIRAMFFKSLCYKITLVWYDSCKISLYWYRLKYLRFFTFARRFYTFTRIYLFARTDTKVRVVIWLWMSAKLTAEVLSWKRFHWLVDTCIAPEDSITFCHGHHCEITHRL